MTDLIACLSGGENSRAHVERLVQGQEWESVVLITNSEGKNNFRTSKQVQFITVDFQKPIFELIEDIRLGVKGKISDFDVALNIVCGCGKEHMAILSALLKLGFGIRLVALTKDGIKEL